MSALSVALHRQKGEENTTGSSPSSAPSIIKSEYNKNIPLPTASTNNIPTPPQSYSSSTGGSVGNSPLTPPTTKVFHNGSGGHRSSTSRRRLSSSSSSTATATTKESSGSGGPLNTNSPIALAAAAAVTPEKLAKLLLSQGPLAIRHITSHLALTIPGFSDLSLSKQRRLIIAVLDSEESANHGGVVFEKVGWGRWACRRTDHHNNNSTLSSSSPYPLHQPYTKSKRRESITAGELGHSVKPPMSPSLNPDVSGDDVDLADDDMMFHNKAVFDDDEDDDDAIIDSDEEDSDEDNRIISDDDNKKYHPYYFNKRSTTNSSRRHSSIARHAVRNNHHRHSETDEEDWQSIGAASLRRNSQSPSSFGFSTSYARKNKIPPSYGGFIDSQKEREAIDALVQLSSI